MTLYNLPSVISQGLSGRMVPKELLGTSAGNRHYNPSVVALADKWWMAYRVHSADQGRGQIVICPARETGMPIGAPQVLELPGRKNGEHHEDPRLFVHARSLWMAYTAASDYDGKFKCAMRLVRLEWQDGRWIVDVELPLHFGNNDLGREKNWQFFSWSARLFFVYTLSPHVVVEINDRNGDVLQVWETPGIQNWEHGTLSGSTPPVRWNDEFVSIFHSAQTHPALVRRYSASAYRFTGTPPFAITHCTEPFLYGSALDGFLPDPRKLPQDPIVVFPGGSIFRDFRTVTLSCGVNDHGCALIDLDLTKLKWLPPEFPIRTRYFFSDCASLTLRGGKAVFLEFDRVKIVDDAWTGVFATANPEAVALARERWDIREITRAEYIAQLASAEPAPVSNP